MKSLLKIFGLLLVAGSLSFSGGAKKVIVIDLGHGGEDAGAQFKNLSEKELVKSIGEKIVALNSYPEVEIVLTRSEDEFVSLQDRVERINALNPSMVISLHIASSNDQTKRGFQFSVGEQNEFLDQSYNTAASLQKTFSANLASQEVQRGEYFLLNRVKAPALMLEIGFLSNVEDRAMLTSEKGQNEIAKAIFETIL